MVRNCDIDNCDNIATRIIDDHGVDTYLCTDHYCEWKAVEEWIVVEKTLKYSLEKWRKQHNA